MHTLKVTLKQHTPLIHFQHDQEGATLRASEVKPKLDKFILKRLSQEERTKGEKEGWIKVKEGKSWLDYKMRIVAEDKPEEYLIASLLPPQAKEDSIEILNETPYFAQEAVNVSKKTDDNPVFIKNGNGRDATYEFDKDNWDSIEKKGLMWDNLSLSIFSLSKDLTEYIDKNLSAFFICTNFGSRSGKGFGSFTRTINNADDILKENFRFVYSKSIGNGGLQRIFKTIKDDYQKLKSGVNFNGYTKSILFCYAVERMQDNPRWEKRFFKKAIKPSLGNQSRLKDNHHDPINDSEGHMSWTDPENFNYRYLRAVLGAAEQIEFLLEYYDTREQQWKQDNRNKAVAKPKIKDIDRHESPILVKVIGNTIYLVGNDVSDNILGKDVTISYKKGNANLYVEEEALKTTTPITFDLVDFMKYAMSERFKLGYTKI